MDHDQTVCSELILPDHQSHMYYTKRLDGFTNDPACPSSHPVRMPQVTYETTWDTTKFNGLWTSGAPNPFVWSFEGMGFGTHADCMFFFLYLKSGFVMVIGW